ncbi:hypothetical protein [Streptomyces sp. NPDC096323]|uniref:hypothetical protein n=1 Tax=Streptomyces sp. NPDC096323 TaxID=3155822 RepID=UPI003325A1E0
MTQTIPKTASLSLAPHIEVKRFNHTGKVQNFTVPAGVTTLTAHCWGGGGTAGGTRSHTMNVEGGGGGYATGDLTVVPGEILQVVVDMGGAAHGGGMSGLFSKRHNKPILIAGGGGGSTITAKGITALGGAGGGTNGSAAQGVVLQQKYKSPGKPAQGASGATGGAPGSVDKSARSGGRGGNAGQDGAKASRGKMAPGTVPIPGMGGGGGAGSNAGCGGGGGYAGGGGGIAGVRGTFGYISGGGGGSSFVQGPGVTNGRTVAGSGARAGGKDDPLYTSPVGDSRNHGQVVLSWALSPAKLETTAGDGQKTGQGTVFGKPLTVKALSSDGKTPVPGSSITFTVTAGDATFGGKKTVTVTTDSTGQAKTPALTAGTTPGPVTVTAKTDSAQVTFALEVARLPVGLLQATADDSQMADQGTAFGQPLTATALSSDGKTPIPGASVTFTITSGDATFPGGATTITVTTDTKGQAKTPALTAKTTPGPITVTTESGSSKVEFSLDATATFKVLPGGPPDVHLVQSGDSGFPGVTILPPGTGATIGLVRVEVRLPAGHDLQWGTAGAPDHQLTVLGGAAHPGTLSPDGQTLTFDNVDPDAATGPEKTLYVRVSAAGGAPLGTTHVTFTVAGKTSPSTPVQVTPGFTVAASGAPVAAAPGGAVVYPGLVVRNTATHAVPLQTVTVTLPAGADMHFGTPSSPDHQLTVWDGHQPAVVYVGTLSPDGQTLTFTDVDLAIPDDTTQTIIYVCVSAGSGTPHGPTTVQFTIDDKTSPSTTINIT